MVDYALCLCHAWHVRRTLRRPPAWRMCHAWHVLRTLRRLFDACATCGFTPHAPPPAWRMCCHAWHVRRVARCRWWTMRWDTLWLCHAWHVRRTLRRPPGACATRGTYAACREVWMVDYAVG